ncbi:MAG: class B sortase [Lachnospiraceae bacterium]|nr:class B sortase [Lachnospiraceae bacterium]
MGVWDSSEKYDIEKGKRGKHIVGLIFLCGLLIVIAVFNMTRSFWEYEAGKQEYSKVEKEYVSLVDPVEKAAAPGAEAEAEEEEEEEESIWTEDQSIPNLSIAHDALAAKNPDYFCWLYIAPIDVSYPVVKGSDNDYYLHHTFEGENNVNGCIYMDSQAWPDMNDYNIFIYGHNMRNGTMFGSLKHILNDPQIALDNPYFYLLQKDAVRKYHIYSVHVAHPISDTFHNPASEQEYADYIKMVKEVSIVDMGVDVTTADKTVTLSTCSGTGAGKKRLVIHGKLVGIINPGKAGVSYNSVKALSNEL